MYLVRLPAEIFSGYEKRCCTAAFLQCFQYTLQFFFAACSGKSENTRARRRMKAGYCGSRRYTGRACASTIVERVHLRRSIFYVSSLQLCIRAAFPCLPRDGILLQVESAAQKNRDEKEICCCE